MLLNLFAISDEDYWVGPCQLLVFACFDGNLFVGIERRKTPDTKCKMTERGGKMSASEIGCTVC